MPYFAETRRKLWNLFIFTLILTILLHEPTFNFALSAIINLHIFMRIALETTRHIVATHFPAFAAWIMHAYHQVYVSVITLYGRTVSAAMPTLRWMAGYLVRYAAYWIVDSPRCLCDVNLWIANFGDRIIEIFKGEVLGAGKLWPQATKAAADFCGLVREQMG